MGARFRRRRASRGEAVKQAIGPLGIVRGRSGRGERTYGAAAVGLGFGALIILTGACLGLFGGGGWGAGA
jgi:hypothetical protein